MSAKTEVSRLGEQLGILDVADPMKYYQRYFRDELSEEVEFRWRLYVPDVSSGRLYFSTGKLEFFLAGIALFNMGENGVAL